MNITKRKQRTVLIVLSALSVLAGGFCLGIGMGKTAVNISLRRSYQDSSVNWRQELAAGTGQEQVRDLRNQELAKNMQYVSINRTLRFSQGSAAAQADISVDARSDFGCVVTILRDATGEQLYKSGVIDPGHYISQIHLDSSLRDGYYPCTAVWSYYGDGDEYVGETAWKVVVVVGK